MGHSSADAAMHVLLDLYGVLLDHEKTFRGYRDRIADLLASRFGGDRKAWLRAHDEAFVTYTRSVNAADWDARGYGDIVDELDASHLLDMFDRVGVAERPEDPLALSRELEREALAGIDARYPDARTAIERIRRMGHRVYVATGGSLTNDAALQGAGLRDLIDGIFTGHSQDAQKGRKAYWFGIPKKLGAKPKQCVLIDDRLDYLAAAASVGIVALLLDRKGALRPEAMPAYVQATLRNLAGLPHWVATWTLAHPS
ncbi:MAG: HAD family hydrolase [Thermoplasmata archaeon]